MLPIGTQTYWGRVVGIGYKGERYYFMLDRKGISLMPASVVEGIYLSKISR